MTEEYRILSQFPDYHIYSDGRVFSTISSGRWKPGFRKSALNKVRGYPQIALIDNSGISKTVKIHRLVALAFIPNPNQLPEVNHKDRNKLNNHVNNLEWCTPQDNVRHAFATGRKTRSCGITKEHIKAIQLEKANGGKLKEIVPKYGFSLENYYYNLSKVDQVKL